MRPSGRLSDALRAVSFDIDVINHAEGSCLIRMGDTHVMCTASLEQKVPSWLRGQGKGWVTAEYGMLPRSTEKRMDREAVKGRQSGRTQEIQRLIGRALRAVTDLSAMGERQVKIDCDVIQADGGTRTAAITGAWVALSCAFRKAQERGFITRSPLVDSVAAISCGMVRGGPLLDLDYKEDSAAETDANFVLTGCGQLVEIQASAEQKPFTRSEFTQLLELAENGTHQLSQLQKTILEKQADHAPAL